MLSLHWRQCLVVAVVLSLMLVMVGVVGLSVAVQDGFVVPPELDVSLRGLHIIAYMTDPIECQPYRPCPGPSRNYYVVWAFHKTAPDYVRETGGRILTVQLMR
jgi:hypothetical protein